MNILKYIAMADANLADEHVPNDDTGWMQTDKEGRAFMKVLWTAKSGGWAVLYRWSKGYVAPAHKHLGSIHAFIVSGRLKLRDLILEAGDYLFEPNGMIHGVTEALEDTVQLNIADGPILFFNETSLTHYAGWEQMQRIREQARAAAKSSEPTGSA
jgi:quercetin dioxygenase-like cupin family protein